MMRSICWMIAALVALQATSTAFADGDPERGKELFARCSGCHTVSGQNKIGPHLSGVFGRTAGTVKGAHYSKALTTSGIVWNEQTLDTFLAGPAKAVPGSTMPLSVPNSQDRADIIAYLKSIP